MAINKGRLINFINGITGISPGGQAVINKPVNVRLHRTILQCSAVNFTGGTGLTATALTGGGTGLQVDVTVAANHTVATIAATSGHTGSGFTTGDTITFTDATGAGFVGTVTASAGAVTAIAITTNGTPTAISPANFFTSIRHLVNGVNMRDIDPLNVLKICIADGYLPRRGELPIWFTAPPRNVNTPNDVTSWDLFGQSTYQVQLGISANLVSPGLTGIDEFDYQRNLMPSADGKSLVPFLQPVSQHQFSFNLVSGRNDLNTLPFNFPISRMWIYADTPGSIYQVECYQDGNKVAEFTDTQLKQAYEEYGFQFGQPNFINQNWASNTTLQSNYVQPVYFDSAFIADPDQRWSKALRCDNTMILRLYSSAAEKATVVMETLPGSYAS